MKRRTPGPKLMTDMKGSRGSGFYLALTALTIALGLGLRKFLPLSVSGIPGDVLYATMVYWLFRAAAPKAEPKKAWGFATLFCVAIEFLKLWSALAPVRKTTVGRLVFGSTFGFENLVWYVAGAALGFALDRALARRA